MHFFQVFINFLFFIEEDFNEDMKQTKYEIPRMET